MLENPPSWLHRALAVLVAALLVAGVVGAATADGGSKVSHVAAGDRSRATTTTSTAPSSTTTTIATVAGAAGTSSSASQAGPAAGSAGTAGAASLGPAGDPGQLSKAKAGSYRYHLAIKSPQGDDQEDTPLVVQDLPGASTGPRQRNTLKTSQGDQVTDVSWRSAGLFLDRQTFNVGGGTTECDWNPDVLDVISPLAVNRSWSGKGHCSTVAHTQFGAIPLDLDIAVTGKVTGTERVLVGTEAVDAWVITGTLEVKGSSSGTEAIHETGTYTSKVSGRLGLEVSRHDEIDITSPQGSGHATSDRRLLGLQPT